MEGQKMAGEGEVALELLAQTVDLWWLDLGVAQRPDWEALGRSPLDAEEQQRANRLRLPQHRRWFIAAHGQLRQVLARYLSQRPEQIRFCRGDRGKPALLDPRLASGELSQPLEFNLSHSGDVGLLGIAQAPVGVDVEQLRPLTDSLSMARRFFSVKEFNFLQSLHESQRSQAFLRHWVCKEAYVKATGEGLVDQLDRVAVALEPEVRWMALPQGDPQQWQLRCLAPTAQTVAAVVVQQAAPLQIRWCRSPRL